MLKNQGAGLRVKEDLRRRSIEVWAEEPMLNLNEAELVIFINATIPMRFNI